MGTISSIGVTIDHVSRRDSSAAGNPRFALHLSDGRVYVTAPNIADAYVICDGWHDRSVRLEIDGRGRVVHVADLGQTS